MTAPTDAFKAALLRSHDITSRAEVWERGVLIQDLPVSAAKVTINRDQAVRRRCAVTVPDADLVPRFYGDLLWPAGNEIKLYRGIEGVQEFSLGYFRISKPKTSDSGIPVLTIDGFDRARQVSRAKFTTPYTIAKNTLYHTAIKNLIKNRVPWLTDAMFNFEVLTHVTPKITFAPNADPWKCAMDMATSCGCELYWDADGICILRTEPDPKEKDVAWYLEEGDLSTLLKVDRSIDDDKAVSGYVVTGESTSNATPVTATAWDTDPSSPTYYLGDFGMVPEFVVSPLVTTTAQAQAMANALIKRKQGFLESVSLSAIANPGMKEGDVLSIKRAASGVDMIGAIESFDIGLNVKDDMNVTMRNRSL